MSRDNKDLIVGLDIGTSKIVALVVLPQVAANLFLPLLLLVLLFPAANESEGAYLTVAATLLAGLLLSVFAANASGQTLAGRLLASAPMLFL